LFDLYKGGQPLLDTIHALSDVAGNNKPIAKALIYRQSMHIEVRNPAGQVELRIKLTEDGPVLQMESARLELKATESVEIESKRVAIKATEKLALESADEVSVEAEGDVRVNGKMIFLN